MTYTIDYKFGLDDRVYYFDQTLGGFSRGTVNQIDIDVSLDALVLENTIKYTLHLPNGSTYQALEDSLFETLSPPSSPGPALYNVTTDFKPGDMAYLAIDEENTIAYVTVAQIDIKIYDGVTSISYWVNPEIDDCYRNESSFKVPASELFATANEAWVALGIIEPPVPTPTPTPGGGGGDPLDSFVVSKINVSGITLTKGTPVSVITSGGVILSGSDTLALTFLGFVYDDTIPPGGAGRILLEGVINNTSASWNDILEENGLLQIGKKYYLAMNGKLSANPATSGYIKQVGFAATPNILDIRIFPTIKL